MRDFIKIFKALSDSNRIRIIKMLENRELCVCEITDVLDLAPSTVSKHLSIMKEADLILDWKDGKWVNYKLNNQIDSKLIQDILNLVSINLNSEIQIINDKLKVNISDRNMICSV
jgi:ArsR family transcriptional regulator